MQQHLQSDAGEGVLTGPDGVDGDNLAQENVTPVGDCCEAPRKNGQPVARFWLLEDLPVVLVPLS